MIDGDNFGGGGGGEMLAVMLLSFVCLFISFFLVRSAELRNGKHENKTGGNWGEQGRRCL